MAHADLYSKLEMTHSVKMGNLIDDDRRDPEHNAMQQEDSDEKKKK